MAPKRNTKNQTIAPVVETNESSDEPVNTVTPKTRTKTSKSGSSPKKKLKTSALVQAFRKAETKAAAEVDTWMSPSTSRFDDGVGLIDPGSNSTSPDRFQPQQRASHRPSKLSVALRKAASGQRLSNGEFALLAEEKKRQSRAYKPPSTTAGESDSTVESPSQQDTFQAAFGDVDSAIEGSQGSQSFHQDELAEHNDQSSQEDGHDGSDGESSYPSAHHW